METVPYAFCDEVCAVLADLDALVELPSDNSNCGIWKSAAEATDAGRVTVSVHVNCKDGVWSYRIRKTAKNQKIDITFQDLKAISRRCVRTSVVRISVDLGYSKENSHISTLEEVTQILKYSALFVNSARMSISEDLKTPDDILTEFLVPFHYSSLSDIRVGSYSKAAEDFLIVQLQSEGLKIIYIRDHGWSDELRVSIECFALTKPFTDVDVNDSLVFDLKFLKKLLRNSCRHDWCAFTACFGVKFRELRELKKEMQIETGDDKIAWRRPDGAEIAISKSIYDDRLWIEFSREN